MWNRVGKSVVRPLLFLEAVVFSSSAFLIFYFPPTNYLSLSFVFLFPLLSQCEGCPDVPVWGLMAGLWGLLAMGEFYCVGAGWSQWRPLDIRGSHLPLSLMQLLKKCILLYFFDNTTISQPIMIIHLTKMKPFSKRGNIHVTLYNNNNTLFNEGNIYYDDTTVYTMALDPLLRILTGRTQTTGYVQACLLYTSPSPRDA